MAAVASVIRNRLAAGGYGKTPTDIVRAPNQFEPWNAGSGNDPRRLGSLRAGLWLLGSFPGEGQPAASVGQGNGQQLQQLAELLAALKAQQPQQPGLLGRKTGLSARSSLAYHHQLDPVA